MRTVPLLLCCLAWWPLMVVTWGASEASGADRTAELVRMIPWDANAVFIVRVQEILRTERAVREQWSEKQAERFLHGETSVPPWVETLVIGSLVRPAVPEAAWSAALAVVPPTVRVESLAAQEGVDREWLGTFPAVLSPRGAIFLEFEPGLLGVMAPPYRQDAGRWARQIRAGGESHVSDYLQQAAQHPGHIVLAIDLQDLLDPQRVRQRLMSDEQLADNPTARIRLATQLLGIRGATMAVTIGEAIDAVVTLEFRDELDPAARALHRVFVNTLAEMGAAIDEFEQAQVAVAGRTLTLQCQFSEASLRRVLSLIITPPPGRPAAPPAEPAPTPAPTPTPPPVASPPAPLSPREASRRYLQAVNKYIDDLKTALSRATSYERTAMWHDNFARKIDSLASKSVDPELLKYGLSVSSHMRALAASLRGQGVEVQAQQGTIAYRYSYDPGYAAFNIWGGVGYRAPTVSFETNLAQVRERQAAAITAGAAERGKIWKLIEDERASIEQLMRRRYGDDFLR